MTASRAWQNLSWPRCLIAAAIAPVPAIYIGFAGFYMAHSGQLLRAKIAAPPVAVLIVWSFTVAAALVYLATISRRRGRIGLVECLFVGAAAAFVLSEVYFASYFVFGVIWSLHLSLFVPGPFLLAMKPHWSVAGAVLGLVFMPAGALSGWIFWHIGVAPAKLS